MVANLGRTENRKNLFSSSCPRWRWHWVSPSSRDLDALVSVRSHRPLWFPAYVAVKNVQSFQKTLLMSTQVFGSSSFEFCQRPLDGGAEFILNGVQQESLVLAVHISFL